jgi:hypothetical protein
MLFTLRVGFYGLLRDRAEFIMITESNSFAGLSHFAKIAGDT